MSKYYAVKEGRKTGIFSSWDECKKYTYGYSGAKFKSFDTFSKAKEYLNGNTINKNIRMVKYGVPEGPFAFVDGSFNKDTMAYGYGCFLVENGKYHTLWGSKVDSNLSKLRNVSGEIAGCISAIDKAINLGLDEITIIYDYQGIESWVTGDWKANNKVTMKYRDYVRSVSSNIKINFMKVKGHTNVLGNDIADILARLAVGNYVSNDDKEKVSKFVNV